MAAKPQWFGHKEAQTKLAQLLGDDRARSVAGFDYTVFTLGGHTWRVAWRSSSTSAAVRDAIHELQDGPKLKRAKCIKLVVVPFMGDAGRSICTQTGVSWLDLAGNAHIAAPGLKVHVEGKANPFLRDRGVSGFFAPKSARIARWLLTNFPAPVKQRLLAAKTQMDEGFTSRIVSGLLKHRLVARNDAGMVTVHDPSLLLGAWAEHYDFNKHTILRGHVPARTNDDLLLRLQNALSDRQGKHFALTGLAAAWQYNRFAAYRLTTAYLREPPTPKTLDKLGFRPTERGANLWLVIPNDDGVFHNAVPFPDDDLTCVSKVQTYLDLAAHPERAKEAAEELRKTLFQEPKPQPAAPAPATRRKVKHGR